MTASSDDAADMLKKNIDDLKETLQKYGVRFDNVSVKTTATQQNAQNQDYTQQDSNQKQQQEQKRESERQDKKQFDEMMNSFTDEDKE
jgi:flagellar hook-length control protein FliK